ncbi:ABC transporter permease [Paenibacillus sp. MCAF20]
MIAFAKLVKFDMKLYLRDWLTVFWVLVYPILMLAIFGSIFGNTTSEPGGMRYIESYVPALCVLNVISVSVFTLNINIITLREAGILRRFRVSPVRKSSVLASHAVQGLLLVLAGALEIIVVAKLFWNINITVSGLFLLLACLLFGCLCFFGLGFAMSGLAKTPGAASGFAMVIFFPMLFLSGVGMPVEALPEFMQAASGWLPMTHFVELAQGVWQGGTLAGYGTDLLIMGGFGMVVIVLALMLFKWEH